jgi:hypothetical protein
MAGITTDPNMIIDPDRTTFHVWSMPQIFIPGGAGGRNVPNIDNWVLEWSTKSYLVYRVIDVDYTTGKSTLQLSHEVPNATDLSETDIILSTYPGKPIKAFRAYIDRSVKPSTVSIDRHLFVLGSLSRYAKLYKGTDIGVNGEVISAMYDQGNTLIGENLLLETVATVAIPSAGVGAVINSGVKIVSPGYLAKDVIDNEVLTLVFYDDVGNIVETASIVAYNTSFSSQPDTSRKYVKDIMLDSSFLSEGDSTNIVIPRNVTLESILAFGKVLYSDGDTKQVPIDGGKMALFGLYNDRYIANSDGMRAKVVLRYLLDPSEYLYGASVGEAPHMSKPYTVETTAFEKAFAARIWAYPTWVDELSGYRMKYYLSTLSRDTLYDVTSKVRLSINSPIFDPLLYGARQSLILTLDLNTVDPVFKSWKFIQPTTITLYGEGNTANTSYTVNYAPGGATVFGLDLKALGDYRSAGSWLLDVSQQAGSKEDWLEKMFYNTLPIHNPANELRAPAPTHFNLVIAGFRQEFPVTGFGGALQIQAQPNPGEPVFFEWILRDGNGDHAMGVSAIPFFQID